MGAFLDKPAVAVSLNTGGLQPSSLPLAEEGSRGVFDPSMCWVPNAAHVATAAPEKSHTTITRPPTARMRPGKGAVMLFAPPNA